MLTTPVLLVAFNRPDWTRQVFNAIREAKPSRLYMAFDGPRVGNEKDVELCNKTRELIKEVDWECQVFTRLLDNNLGSGIGVSSAITWAFENEEQLIILEDDTVPVLPFFGFCEAMLNKYAVDTRVYQVSGSNHVSKYWTAEESYLFTLYGDIWGWATWKRAWLKFDFYMKDWPEFCKKGQIVNSFRTMNEQIYFFKLYGRIYSDIEKVRAWDFQWFYTRFKNAGLSIVPQKNLVSNIGVEGTHTSKKRWNHLLPADNQFRILTEPGFMLRSKDFETVYAKHVLGLLRPPLVRFLKRLYALYKKCF